MAIIIANVRFERSDFAERKDRYEPRTFSDWLEEWIYTYARDKGNATCCSAMEAAWGRKPFRYRGKRLAVNDSIVWPLAVNDGKVMRGESVFVTSFVENDGDWQIVLSRYRSCSYRDDHRCGQPLNRYKLPHSSDGLKILSQIGDLFDRNFECDIPWEERQEKISGLLRDLETELGRKA